jgi:hypothetical protein
VVVDKRGMAKRPRTYAVQDVVGPDRVTVGANRRRSLAWGLFLGMIVAGGAGRAITARSVSGLVIDLLVPVIPCAFYLQRALIGRALIVIDAHGFTDYRSGRTVEWAEIETARANTHQGAFGLDNSLRLVLKSHPRGQPAKRRLITMNATPEHEIEVSLDQLSLPWEEVVDAVESKLGRRVIRTSDPGFEDVRRSAPSQHPPLLL